MEYLPTCSKNHLNMRVNLPCIDAMGIVSMLFPVIFVAYLNDIV